MSFSLYIHWPFCKSKCPYCDFNSHVREGVDKDAWLNAYLTELRYFTPYLQGKKVESVFFGGGTPSLMPPAIVDAILNELANLCDMPIGTEVTLEANPTSVEAGTFPAFKAAGVNRVSLGIQSLNAEDLRFLGREHSVTEALAALDHARNTFSRYSFDLIYALPGQSLQAWEKELKAALPYAGQHLSLYQLTIEKGTPFYSLHAKGGFALPTEEDAASFYTLTQDIMEAAGMPAYEISNHAAPGEECRHNMQYWRYGEYLGIGPGAHSRIRKDGKNYALMTIHQPENWLQSVAEKGHGIQTETVLMPEETLEEMLLMGLRLREGIRADSFPRILRKPLEECVPIAILHALQQEGLLNWDGQVLALTAKGMLLHNGVVGKLVG